MAVKVNEDGALKNTTEGSFYESVGMKWTPIHTNYSNYLLLEWVPKLVMIVISFNNCTGFAVLTDEYPSTVVPVGFSNNNQILTNWISMEDKTVDLGKYAYTGFATCFYFR